MDAIFEVINQELQQEHDVRNKLKELVKLLQENNRKLTVVCQQIHSDYNKVNDIIHKAKELLKEQRNTYVKLAEQAQGETRFKFSSLWKNIAQKDVFVYTFITWLETGKLASLEETQNFVFGSQGIPVELENYLVGVTFLTPELVSYFFLANLVSTLCKCCYRR